MELVIRLKEGEKIRVERYEGGLKTGERKVYFNDFVLGLMQELPNTELLHLVMQRDMEVIEDFLGYFDSDSDEYERLLELILQYVNVSSGNLQEDTRFRRILYESIRKIDWATVDPNTLNEFFRHALHRISQMENDKNLKELVLALLEKLHLFKHAQQELTPLVLEKFASFAESTTSQEELKLLYQAILKHADGQWVRETINLVDQREYSLVKMTPPKNLVYYEATTKKEIYVIEVPKTRFRVKFHDVAYEDVGHPRLLFVFVVNNQKVHEMYLFAAKEKDNTLYRYPFSNVFDTGKVCWNGYHNEIVTHGKDLNTIALLFLNTTNNTHLNEKVRQLFEYYQGKDFEEEQLVPFGKTIEEFVDSLKR